MSLLAAMTFAWVRGTPFGGPVDPEVYMMQQRSSGDGGTGSTGFCSPNVRRSSKLMTLMSSYSVFSLSRSACLGAKCEFQMMCLIDLTSLSTLATEGMRLGSQNMATLDVWTRECFNPSSPRVS